jgi:HEAT repeat protein
VQSNAGDTNPIRREAQIRSLALDGTKSLDSIKKLLGEPDPLVSSAAIFALNAMTADVKKQIREGHLLGDAVEHVVTALGNPDAAVRQEALRCINWYDPAAVLPQARALLKSKSPSDRALAATILKTYGSGDALPMLKQAEFAEPDQGTLTQIKSARTVVQNLQSVSNQREGLDTSARQN